MTKTLHLSNISPLQEKTGKVYEIHIYPEGGHVWNQQTIWRDAYQKYQDALEKYLG